jgi:hypothetical protein
MSILESISGVIEVLGGAAVISTERALPYTTVASWKARGAIPGREWPGLVELARKRKVAGVTLQRLAELHAVRARRDKRSRAA